MKHRHHISRPKIRCHNSETNEIEEQIMKHLAEEKRTEKK